MSWYNTLPPIDIMVNVAGHHFPAHRSILARHSGYFRDILLSENDDREAVRSDISCGAAIKMDGLRGPAVVVSLPSIAPASFAALLDYMYSSRLQLDAQNVSGVLHGAHALNMPKVVDLCQHYILGLHPSPHLGSYPATLRYRPPPPHCLWHAIPSLIHLPPLLPITAAHHEAHLVHHGLLPTTPTARILPLAAPPPSTRTTASTTPVRPIPSRRPLGTTEKSTLFLTTSSPPQQQQQHYHHHHYHHQVTAAPSAPTGGSLRTTTAPELSESRAPSSDSIVSVTKIDSDACLTDDDGGDSSDSVGMPTLTIDVPRPTSDVSSSTHHPGAGGGERQQPQNKIIVDVAYCDGPVKFQRILNENSDLVLVMRASSNRHVPPATAPHRKPVTTTAAAASSAHKKKARLSHTGQPSKKGSVAAAAAEIPQRSSDPQPPPPPPAATATTEPEGHEDTDTFLCAYCRHSFKSRYCYNKHKRRHLNPLTVDTAAATTAPDSDDDDHKQQTGLAVAAIAEDKSAPTARCHLVDGSDSEPSTCGSLPPTPLEINSTFYPCKQCGSKFPSYYFVHKHRRMCHRAARPQMDSNTQSSQEGGID